MIEKDKDNSLSSPERRPRDNRPNGHPLMLYTLARTTMRELYGRAHGDGDAPLRMQPAESATELLTLMLLDPQVEPNAPGAPAELD
ncbi:MAG: hypothetical protein JWS12_194 [Candidatus Saccharibacteria bacterium]|nr:hypothetical protein [Candidatus Saccharibacteria bacterium]